MDENEADRIQDKIRQERKPEKVKKFYKKASVRGKKAPFSIALDGRVLKTPSKEPLEIPSRALARAVADEWNAQQEFVDLNAMFLTKYASAAQDGTMQRKEAIVDEIVAYASSDLVCYRADTPQGLVDRQTNAWDPVLEWARKTHNLKFICVAGIIYATQPDTTLAQAHKLLMEKDPHTLTGIHHLTNLLGSALLSIAVTEGALSDNDCWNAAHLDEDWNIEQWGTDEDAMERRKVRRTEFDGILRFCELVS